MAGDAPLIGDDGSAPLQQWHEGGTGLDGNKHFALFDGLPDRIRTEDDACATPVESRPRGLPNQLIRIFLPNDFSLVGQTHQKISGLRKEPDLIFTRKGLKYKTAPVPMAVTTPVVRPNVLCINVILRRAMRLSVALSV